MFSNIITKTTFERKYNEDGYVFRDDLVCVIDGATGLGENDYMGCGDDATWFVENVCKALQLLDFNQSIEKYLSSICAQLYSEYTLMAKELNTYAMPSSCISLFREVNDEIEYYGLGDTVGVVEFVDGTFEVLYDQKLVDLDNIAIKEMADIAKKKGISPIEARPFVQSTLIKHRSMMNTEEGYYSLELMGKGLPFAMKRRWKKDSIKRVCCMSDGFYEIVEFGLYKDMATLLDAIEENVDDVFSKLYDAQNEDLKGYKLPRFKVRDDITVVYAKRKEAY